jgi:hypothetical protein
MPKNTYWIADAEGHKACVATEADRDEWVQVRGWTEATEPVDGEFQWIRNVNHGGKGEMVHEAVPLHAGRGWLPSGPPGYDEPDLTPAKSSPPKATATSGDKIKE